MLEINELIEIKSEDELSCTEIFHDIELAATHECCKNQDHKDDHRCYCGEEW